MKHIITASAIALLLVSPAYAHKKKEVHIECLFNEIYDVENNTCVLLENDNGSFLQNEDNISVVENDLDWPGNSDNRRQDIDRAQRTGNNGRGTGDALDRGDPPGKGNTKNDIN